MRVVPVSDTSRSADDALTAFPVATSYHREEADTYPVIVAKLNLTWRVIVCRDEIQWILQRLAGKRHGQPRWDGRCYCRTREGLMCRVRELAGEIDPAALQTLEALPDWIGGVRD